MSTTYDDDRPGMLRIHIAEQRAQTLCDMYTRETLRRMARDLGLACPRGATKRDVALTLAFDGVKP